MRVSTGNYDVKWDGGVLSDSKRMYLSATE